MGLVSIVPVDIGQVGVIPRTFKMVTTDALNTVTTAGYLNGTGNQLTTLNLSPLDVVECMYSYNAATGTATFTILTVTVTNGVITLSEWRTP